VSDDPATGGAPAVRPEDLLNAYLDGELDPAERALVEDWLAADPARRAELDAYASVRDAVRGLPWLDLPAALAPARSPLFGRVRSRGSRGRSGVLSAVAGGAAAMVLVAVMAVGGGGGVAQAAEVPVEQVVAAHTGKMRWSAPSAEQAALYTAPAYVGHHWVDATIRLESGLVGLHYTDGDNGFSVFETPGRVRWDRLEGRGRRLAVSGNPAWIGVHDGYYVLVVQHGHRVYVVVDDDEQSATEVSEEMPGAPAPGASLWSRVTARCHDTLDLFGLRD
jgi:hypothetical protein